MTIVNEDKCVEKHHESHTKRAYRVPELRFFGKVSALTQSGTGCIDNDSSTCTPGTGNMGNRPSDRATKEHIVRIGDHPLGVGLYLFDYKPEFVDEWGHGRQFGVMAQEVEIVKPEAVCEHPDGYKMVNYAMLGISHQIQ